MKSRVILGAITVISLLATQVIGQRGQLRGEQNDSQTKSRAAVVIAVRQTYHFVPYDPSNPNNGYNTEDGMVVHYASGSSNAPSIPEGTNIGEALAVLLAKGFHLEPPNGYGFFILVR